MNFFFFRGSWSPTLKLATRFALVQIGFFSHIGFAGSVQQTTAHFPTSRAQLPRFARPSPLAEQASASFAALPPQKGGAALQPLRHRFDGPSEESVPPAVLPVCGPAPDSFSFACFNLATGESLADMPLPGHVTTVPQFYDGSWYVGTSRGFFARYEANGVYLTPGFGLDSLLFHGPDARATMKSLATSAASSTLGDSSGQSLRSRFRGAWSWYATANAEFIGTPQMGGGRVFVLTANQSLNAYDIQNGKLLWGVRLAPEVQLRLASTSLVLHERGVLVGTNDGNLLLLDPKNGQTLWRQSVTGDAGLRFPAISAPVLALSDGIIVSNAESVTQRINWDARSTEWSYGTGSVVQPKYDEGTVYVAGSDGALHKLDVRTGQLRWKRALPTTSPLVALTLLKKQDIAMVASANGSVFAVRMTNGELDSISNSSTYGPVIGDFFAGRVEQNEVCLSYRTPGYACWTWSSEPRSTRYVN